MHEGTETALELQIPGVIPRIEDITEIAFSEERELICWRIFSIINFHIHMTTCIYVISEDLHNVMSPFELMQFRTKYCINSCFQSI